MSEQMPAPGVGAAGRQARRIEQATDDRALVRAGTSPSPLAVQIAGVLGNLWSNYQTGGMDMGDPIPIEGTPSAFWIEGLRNGRKVLVHVMEVGQ
jgi:hypothetical protein